ncbi:MAG: response regulator transcription factor [Chloroflexota bacterium]
MSRILVVDDEPRIVDVVRAYLEREGHVVEVAHDGDAALAAARHAPPDLVVLDVMLPGRTGFDVLRALRAESDPGPAVILLTARDDVIDRVAGLELGADDYVTKPFEPRELVARVGAVLRRLRPAVPAPGAGGSPVAGSPTPSGAPTVDGHSRLSLTDLEIDPLAREVAREGRPIELTRTELDLLIAFAEQPDRAWTREQLGARVHGEEFDAFDRSIDSHVKNLRAKLGARPDGSAYVNTVRGIGYRAGRR